MGGKVRRGKPHGHGATTVLHYMAGTRVDRRQAHVRMVDRMAEGLARQLGARRFRDLPESQAMTVFHCATMHVVATAYATEFYRTGDLGLFDRYSAAVGNTRRLLASLGLQAEAVEEVGELERALRQGTHGRPAAHTVAASGERRGGDVAADGGE